MEEVDGRTSLSLQLCEEELAKIAPAVKLTDEQASTVHALCMGKDCYYIMPTGSGKSMVFIATVLGTKRAVARSICVVVSPLVSLNKNHVESFDKFNLRYWNLNDESLVREQNPQPDIIIASPEKLHIHKKELKKFKDFERVLIVVDECHTILSWGNNFRPVFKELDRTFALFKKKPVVLLMTATLTAGNREKLFDELGLRSSETFRLVRNPVEANTSFISLKEEFSMKTAKELVAMLECLGSSAPRCVIFTSNTTETLLIKDMILEDLKTPLRKHVDWCTAANTKAMKNDIVENLLIPSGSLRILVTTSLLSMGVDMKAVRYVMISKMTGDVEEFLQRAGRAGRDGTDCYCVLFAGPKPRDCSRQAAQIRENPSEECLRLLLGRYFEGETASYNGGDICCSTCAWTSKDELVSPLMSSIGTKTRKRLFEEGHKRRTVSKEDRRILGLSLKELRDRLAQAIYSNVPIAPCHLTNGIIKKLQENAHFLFTQKDVQKIIGDEFTAQMVLEEVCDFFEDFKIETNAAKPTTVMEIDPFWNPNITLAPI